MIKLNLGGKMKYLIMILISVFMLSCACFSLDGKAASWCNAGLAANKLCKQHNGVKTYDIYTATCNDGWKSDSQHWSDR